MSDDEIVERVRAEFAQESEQDRRRKLERRLRRDVFCLKNDLRPFFREARFDGLRLVSACGRFALQSKGRGKIGLVELEGATC